MFPRLRLLGPRSPTFLCLRRGVSDPIRLSPQTPAFSLPTQRCFPRTLQAFGNSLLFSAYAEVFPTRAALAAPAAAFLCLRRGVSAGRIYALIVDSFSLPTQRCFRFNAQNALALQLFSAYAEVFPRIAPRNLAGPPFLCLRRGVSVRRLLQYIARVFSLPTQRCFVQIFHKRPILKLFSAYAEVFLTVGIVFVDLLPFLCLRRGVSGSSLIFSGLSTFSLPTQRCFYERHHLQGSIPPFLCLRRGVSFTVPEALDAAFFSLPTQRCFQSKYAAVDYGSLFSAYAEVFPSTLKTPRKASPFLCLRRGVSRSSTPNAMIRSFSLPTQRCFFLSISEGWERSLFSAYAEVFL